MAGPAPATGALPRPKRRPTSTLSSTDRVRKGRGTWWVRTMPWRTAAKAGAPVRSRPSKTMRPAVGRRAPARTASRVVLPAPFGPIRPKMPPCSSSKLTSCKAASPAKVLVRRSTSRSGGMRPPFAVVAPATPATPAISSAHQPRGEPDDARRLEEDDHDQQRAVDQQVQLREGGEDLVVHQPIDAGADDRSPDRPDAADDRHQQDGHADRESELSLRVHVSGIAGVQAARGAGEGGGDGVREQLGAQDRKSTRLNSSHM